jgi:S1-C subfamily serine protease
MYRLLGFTLTVLLCVPVCPVRGDDVTPSRDVRLLEEAVQNAVQAAEPAVTCILVSRSDVYKKLFQDEPPADSPGKLGAFDPSRFPLEQPSLTRRGRFGIGPTPDDGAKKYDLADPGYVPEAYGSGVVIDGQRLLVLTNYHLVRDATKIYVRLSGGKGCYADIHAADPRSDLAVLRLLDGRIGSLETIKFGDAEAIRKGQFVVSLANPFAAGFRDGSASASWGIISNVRRRAAAQPALDERSALHLHATLLQTDARLNVSCSGGALLNLKGEMIGLTTARAALTGGDTAGGFAIPLDAGVRRIVDKLREGLEVEYGFLGVQNDSRPGSGVGIQGVYVGGPAFKFGLRDNDRILAIDGVPVHDFEDLFLTVSMQLAGAKVHVKRLRPPSQKPEEVTVELDKSFVPGKIIATKKPPPVRGIRVDYTSVLLLQNLAAGVPRFNPVVVPLGVFVCEVQPNSPANRVRLQLNDVITHVEGREVKTPAEFYREAGKLAPSAPMELTIASSEWHRATPPSKLKIPGSTSPTTR